MPGRLDLKSLERLLRWESVSVAALLQTSRGAVLTEWVDRTFSDERSIGNRTSGRSDQWMLFPQVMRDAPLWGFGPGSGARVYAHYSALDPRVKLEPGREIVQALELRADAWISRRSQGEAGLCDDRVDVAAHDGFHLVDGGVRGRPAQLARGQLGDGYGHAHDHRHDQRANGQPQARAPATGRPGLSP